MSAIPVVFDCNVFLHAMLSATGAAHACWEKVFAGEFKLYVSPLVLVEIRDLSTHKKLRRIRSLTPDRIERFVEEILSLVELVPDPPVSFVYPRDPDDGRYVDLALSMRAQLLVSNNLDLLELMNEHSPEGQSLRDVGLKIVTPAAMLDIARPIKN